MRRPRQRPLRGLQFFMRKIGSGLDESTRVESQTSLQPFRARRSACHDEDVLDIMTLGKPAVSSPFNALELSIPLEFRQLSAFVQNDGGAFLDPSDQIPRHRLGE